MSQSLASIREEAEKSIANAKARRAKKAKRDRYFWWLVLIAMTLWIGFIAYIAIRVLP